MTQVSGFCLGGFCWVSRGGSYCMQICNCLTHSVRVLIYDYNIVIEYSFCGHSSSCLVSFDLCFKNMIRPVSHDRSTTKKGASDATMPQLGSTARLLKYAFC